MDCWAWAGSALCECAIHGMRETMRAVLRLTVAMFAGGLWLGPSAALAQSTTQPTTNTPATNTIGPRDLQDFNLNGTVTRPADTPPPTPSSRVQSRGPSPSPTDSTGTAGSRSEAVVPSRPIAQAPSAARNPQSASRPGQSLTFAPPTSAMASTV